GAGQDAAAASPSIDAVEPVRSFRAAPSASSIPTDDGAHATSRGCLAREAERDTHSAQGYRRFEGWVSEGRGAHLGVPPGQIAGGSSAETVTSGQLASRRKLLSAWSMGSPAGP